MAIPESFQRNFETLLRAARDGNVALVECSDAHSAAPRYILCAIGCDGEDYLMTPFGHLHDGDPYEAYLRPAS